MKPVPTEEAKARSRRNIVLALGLAAFVIVVFIVTLVHMGANAATPPL